MTRRLITCTLPTCLLLVHTMLAHSQPPAKITPRQISEEDKAPWREDAEHKLESSDSRLAMRVTWMLEELWKQGWPANVASAHRTLEAQRKSFELGHSKTLRSKHLCGKAVDFNLFPHHYPDADHEFWDDKDALAKTQKLLTLDAPAFRDRPHVELDEDCDWDAVELGPAGTWTSKHGTLTIHKDAQRGYKGQLETSRARHVIDKVTVRHTHSGERGMYEDAQVDIEFEDGEGKRITRTYTVSTLTSEAHGYRRADWRWLAHGTRRFERAGSTP